MIDPNTNLRGETVQDYCQRRWGGDGWTRHLKQEGERDGAQFGQWQWWPHTLRAHQLVQYLQSRCRVSTDVVNQRLFQAEYEEGQNLSNVETLVQIGQELIESTAEGAEFDKQRLRDYLVNNQGADHVQREIQQGRQRYRITGVPFFVISSLSTQQRPYGLSGAQRAEAFLEVFRQLSGEEDDSDNGDGDYNGIE